MAAGATRGMPLLSGPPPPEVGGETHCRSCCKEFNILFARSKRCYHCGYSYCNSSACTGHQALMPRAGGTGYEVMPVCGLCIDMLMITASSKAYLKLQPLSKLRNYCHAYNIQAAGVLEKEDLVDRIISIRTVNGCLPAENETFFRQHSVPDNPGDRARARTNFFNPESSPAPPTRPATQPPTGPPPLRTPFTSRPRAPSPPPAPAAPPRPDAPQRPSTTVPDRAAPPPRPPPPPRPTAPQPIAPSLERLLLMTDDAISALTISQLTRVLNDNHVNTRLLIEKADLIDKVRTLVHNERADRLRRAEEEEREEREERERQIAAMRDIEERQKATAAGGAPGASTSLPKGPLPPEKQGLCVVCQDDDSCIAVIDCGHLCMCKGCSDLVMNSTRECPLCRIRVVSDARLLRIYRS